MCAYIRDWLLLLLFIFIITVGFLDPENIPMRNIFEKFGQEGKTPGGIVSTPLDVSVAKYLGYLRVNQRNAVRHMIDPASTWSDLIYYIPNQEIVERRDRKSKRTLILESGTAIFDGWQWRFLMNLKWNKEESSLFIILLALWKEGWAQKKLCAG